MFRNADLRDRVLVVVLAGGEGKRLMPLTKTRTKPAVAIGGKYRLIDIPLSNAANSGLMKSFILTQGLDRSLNWHIKNTWYSDRHHNAFTEVISPQGVGNTYRGDADAVRQIMDEIKAVKPSYVLVVPGDHLLKMDYFKLVKFLVEKEADAAISIIKQSTDLASQFGSLQVDKDDVITAFREKDPETPFAFPDENKPGKKVFFASMGIYAFKTKVLSKALKVDGDLFGQQVIPEILPNMKIVGYNYNEHNNIVDRRWVQINDIMVEEYECSTDSDYWRDVGTISQYFNANMDLTGISPAFNLYGERWPFFTSKRDLGPAKIIRTHGGENIESAIVSEGSVLSNVKGKNVVVAPRVYIDKSDLDHVIILGGSTIQKCWIKNTIIDKRVHLMDMAIGFDEDEDRKRGIYVDPESGIRVIPKEYEYTYQWFQDKRNEFFDTDEEE